MFYYLVCLSSACIIEPVWVPINITVSVHNRRLRGENPSTIISLRTRKSAHFTEAFHATIRAMGGKMKILLYMVAIREPGYTMVTKIP